MLRRGQQPQDGVAGGDGRHLPGQHLLVTGPLIVVAVAVHRRVRQRRAPRGEAEGQAPGVAGGLGFFLAGDGGDHAGAARLAELHCSQADTAGSAKDQYAEYYSKVAKKSEENSGYVEKEIARLQSLLKKGGLTTEKTDDLVRRSNILNVFKGSESGKDEL